jgi:F-type H+-transporting ATPase subunit gamma
MNIRQVRKKIKSVTNVKKITKAMQLVAAVKMRKAQQMVIEGQPYRQLLEEMINRLLVKVNVNYSPLLQLEINSEVKRELVLFLSSNKGLCGAFNVNLFRFLVEEKEIDNKDFICVGKKGGAFIAKLGGKVIADFSQRDPLIQISAISNLILEKYFSQQYYQVSLIYNQFISTLKFITKKEILLPMKNKFKQNNNMPQSQTEYLIEPSAKEILEPVLNSYFEEKIRAAVINSIAVEESSRMIAMKNATDNANDVIYNLTLLGNKLRQQKITYELLDMVTAKESVENN